MESFKKHASRAGWIVYGMEGYEVEKGLRRGGVLTFVKKELKQRQMWKAKEGEATAIILWKEGWKAGNCYAPPYEGELDNLGLIFRY